MPLRIKCPTGHKLIVPDDRAGRSLRCPRCGQVTVVPAAEGRGQESGVRGQGTGVRSQESGDRGQGTEDRRQEAAVASQWEGDAPAEPRHDPLPSAEHRSDSSVFDWPNSIAPPTTMLGPEEQVAVEAPPIPEPPPPPRLPPTPVVKPKSRALPPREPPPVSELAPTASEPGPPPVATPPRPQKDPAAANTIAAALQTAFPPTTPAADLAAPPPVAEPAASINDAPTPTESWAPHAAAIEPAIAVSEPAPIPPPVVVPDEQPSATTVEAPPVANAPAASPPPRQLAPDREHRLAVYQLAAVLVAAALFSVVPAIWDVVEYVRIPESQFVARWALVLFLLGVVQIAYAAFLLQLPDWTSVWVVTIYSLLLAAIYAAVLGLVLISSESGLVVRALQLADKLEGGKAILWCLCMVSLSTILAFFAGRLSARWHKTEMFLRRTGLTHGA